MRLVLTTPLRPEGEIAAHIQKHGDGVKDVALWVDDARDAGAETTKRGAKSVREPFEQKDEHGTVTMASIATYGETIRTFVERKDYNGPFLPGLPCNARGHAGASSGPAAYRSHGWECELERDEYLRRLLPRRDGFGLYQHFDDADISTEYSALMSKVMANGNGHVKSLSTSRPKDGGSRRSRSIWTFTAAQACSVWRSPPTTFRRPSRSCSGRAWSS